MPLRRASTAYIFQAEQLLNNDRQWAAYESRGNCVVLAGPGSGKTKTLTLKLARALAEDVRAPRGIACITYSQECTRELTRRMESLGLRDSPCLFIGTVHGFCLRHLLIPYGKLANLGLPDPITVSCIDHAQQVFVAIRARIFGETSTLRKADVDKHRRIHPDRAVRSWRESEDLAILAEAYEEALHHEGFIDYEDLVIYGERLVTQHDWVLPLVRACFPIIAVDEYQDLGIGLHRIIKRLVFEGGVRLFAVGDADQSVYGFNGADSSLLHELAERPEVECIKLQVNYRCAEAIVRVSERALGESRYYRSHNPDRQAQIDIVECPNGLEQQVRRAIEMIVPAALLSKPGRKIGDIAILYRNASIGDMVATVAAESGINFIRVDTSAPYRKCAITSWIEDCAAWCAGGWRNATPSLQGLIRRWLTFHHLRLPESDARIELKKLTQFLWSNRKNQSARYFVNSIRTELLDNLIAVHASLTDQATQMEAMTRALQVGGTLQDLDMARLGGRDGSSNQLNLLTLHSAKGCEYDVVIMLGLDEGSFHWTNVSGNDLLESRRLFYVGVTRARDAIHMLYSGWNENRGRRYYSGPLRFLKELAID